MVLSVIVPDNRLGMQRMLDTQLQDIDSEVIYKSWDEGLQIARGDFVCLLEHDSAISKGSIELQLEPFLYNPSFRKLAMVSPIVEFEDTEALPLDGLIRSHIQLSRVACVPGAVIRRSSLLECKDMLSNNISSMSNIISIAFWENGLRVMTEPKAIYYSPQKKIRGAVTKVSNETLSLWKRECI